MPVFAQNCLTLTNLHDAGDHMSLRPRQRWTLVFGGIAITLLLAAIFTFGSLDVPFKPGNWRAVMGLSPASSPPRFSSSASS